MSRIGVLLVDIFVQNAKFGTFSEYFLRMRDPQTFRPELLQSTRYSSWIMKMEAYSTATKYLQGYPKRSDEYSLRKT